MLREMIEHREAQSSFLPDLGLDAFSGSCTALPISSRSQLHSQGPQMKSEPLCMISRLRKTTALLKRDDGSKGRSISGLRANAVLTLTPVPARAGGLVSWRESWETPAPGSLVGIAAANRE